jgi:cell division protein FtsL
MATLATILDRFGAVKTSEESLPRARYLEPEDPYGIPVYPNDDVYFFKKHIANSGVVRVADPAAGKVCWRMIGYSFVLAILIISLLLPNLYELMAGYRMEALRQEKEHLELNRAALELEETKLVSPARLEELARMQRFVDPAPESVVYLEGKSDSILAKK